MARPRPTWKCALCTTINHQSLSHCYQCTGAKTLEAPELAWVDPPDELKGIPGIPMWGSELKALGLSPRRHCYRYHVRGYCYMHACPFQHEGSRRGGFIMPPHT